MKQYSPTGRRNHGRPLKRLLDTWDRNGSTSGPTPRQIYDDDDDDDDDILRSKTFFSDNLWLGLLTACEQVQDGPTRKLSIPDGVIGIFH